MIPDGRVHARLRKLAATGPIAAMIVGQHARQVAGANSFRTVDTWETSTHLFGRFASEYGRMESSTFEAFHLYLETSGLAPSSKQGYYQGAAALARGLMDRGKVARFRIPYRYPEEQVRSVTPPPRRLVDGLADGVTGVDDGELLIAIVEWTYGRLDRWQDLMAMGHAIVAASADAFSAAEAGAETRGRGRMGTAWVADLLIRRGAEMQTLGIPTDHHSLAQLAYCLAYASKHYDGVPLTHTQFDALGGRSKAGRMYRSYLSAIGMSTPGLFTEMMVPGHEQAAAMALLLAAAMVNADSIRTIRRDCLKPSLEPAVWLLCWSKPRAGGELPGTAFDEPDSDLEGGDGGASPDGGRSRPVRDGGGHKPTWSIVHAIRTYGGASEPLRRRVAPETGFRSRLLLAQPRFAWLGTVPEEVTSTKMHRAVERLAARCVADLAFEDPRLAGLKFTLRSVRVSSIQQFHRSAGSLGATSAAAKQRSSAVTAEYVDTPELRAANTADARSVQERMVSSIRDGTFVVKQEDAPPGLQQIGHGSGCRDRLASPMPGARPGSPCEEFLACLGCANAVVVATPLNFALLARFRDHLQGDGDRRYREPEAYDRWARPALEMVIRALASFPPDMAQAGEAIAPRLDIDFGVIW